MEDLSSADSWRHYDELSPEKKALLLSFMDSSAMEQVLDSKPRGESAKKWGPASGDFAGSDRGAAPKAVDGAPSPAAASRPPRPSTAVVRAGGDVKDIWRARANLKVAKVRRRSKLQMCSRKMSNQLLELCRVYWHDEVSQSLAHTIAGKARAAPGGGSRGVEMEI